MTASLKKACELTLSAPKLPKRTDPIALERIDKRLAVGSQNRRREKESWTSFLARPDLSAPAALKAPELKRLLDELWQDQSLDARANEILDCGVSKTRKSIDRTIVTSYLRHFPLKHPAFEHFTSASAFVASRHAWPWRERGQRWELWSPAVGPKRVSRALLDADEPMSALRAVGLDGDLATGQFARWAFLDACAVTSELRGEAAQRAGRKLVALFDEIPTSASETAALAFALLAPWTGGTCTEAHQRLVTGILVKRVGDPRLAPARWTALKQEVLKFNPGARVDEAFSVLRRWLVQATVREFFAIVAKTVARRDQWKERTDFWLAYLDSGMITDAWFAFGAMAERAARDLMDDETMKYATLEGSAATSAQSSLIFSIGDLRIAEWSDNGKCRFWKAEDRAAPPLYRIKYQSEKLRAMTAGQGFAAISHNPPNGWQHKFARHVYRVTGIPHPKHGAGW